MHADKTKTSSSFSSLRLSAFICGLILLCVSGGCAAQKDAETIDTAVADYFNGDYANAAKLIDPLAKKTNEDFVINNLRLGSINFAAANLDETEAALLRAIEVINSTGVNNGGRTLGAVLVDEKIKVWKGEPFERAMASFYLGTLYYIRHDYQNARASFENALFKLRDYNPDASSNSADVDSNFAPAILMLAKSYQRIGRDDLAKANFDLIRQKFPDLSPLADESVNANSNLLLVIDSGHGPRKVTDFDGAIVGFGPKPHEEGPIGRPIIRIDGAIASNYELTHPPIDLLALAQQRRWQSIDTIRTIKSAVGTGLLIGGAATGIHGINSTGARQRTDLMVAGGLIGAGLLLKATSQADVRQWEMLPRTTFIVPLHCAPGAHEISIEFPNGTRELWRAMTVPEQGESTYYIRMQRWLSGPFTRPPGTMPSTVN